MEEELERMRCESMYSGRADALEELEKDLKRRAGVCFSMNKDEEAQWLRQLSIDVGNRALEERKKQKKFSPNGPSFGV